MPNLTNVVGTYAAYKFIQILTSDWTEMDAYEHGIIDAEGTQLRKYDELTTTKERQSYTMFHRLAFNIKRILSKLPAVRSRLGTLATALWLLREHHKFPVEKILTENVSRPVAGFLTEERTPGSSVIREGYYLTTEDTYNVEGDLVPAGSKVVVTETTLSTITSLGIKLFNLDGVIVSKDMLKEDVTAGLEGGGLQGGNIATTDKPVGTVTRRHTFANCDVFDIGPEEFSKCMNGKPKFKHYRKYVGMDEVGEEIRSYARKNPSKTIIVRNAQTGSMVYLRKAGE